MIARGVRRQAAEASLELVVVGHRRRDVRDGRPMQRAQLDIDAMAAKPPRLVEAGC